MSHSSTSAKNLRPEGEGLSYSTIARLHFEFLLRLVAVEPQILRSWDFSRRP